MPAARAITPSGASTAASATSATRRSPRTICRGTARWRCSTSTTTTATARRTSSTTRSDVLTVSIHGHPSHAYPNFSGYSDERGEGVGPRLQPQLPARAAGRRRALSDAAGPGARRRARLQAALSRPVDRLRHHARRPDRLVRRHERRACSASAGASAASGCRRSSCRRAAIRLGNLRPARTPSSAASSKPGTIEPLTRAAWVLGRGAPAACRPHRADKSWSRRRQSTSRWRRTPRTPSCWCS